MPVDDIPWWRGASHMRFSICRFIWGLLSWGMRIFY